MKRYGSGWLPGLRLARRKERHCEDNSRGAVQMNTAAHAPRSEGAHWYLPNGEPFYEVPYADPAKGMRNATLADARRVGALPGVSTILNVLHKPGLVTWLTEQACLAVLTTPRNEGEHLDAFVQRVLQTEKVQEQEAKKARDLGTVLHDALQRLSMGQEVDPDLLPWIQPAFKKAMKLGKGVAAEKIVIGDGYGGRIDLILKEGTWWRVIDWKTARKLPKGEAWVEHTLQRSAYAAALHAQLEAETLKPVSYHSVRTTNVYISTSNQGEYAVCDDSAPWWETYQKGFKPLVQYWRFANNYAP